MYRASAPPQLPAASSSSSARLPPSSAISSPAYDYQPPGSDIPSSSADDDGAYTYRGPQEEPSAEEDNAPSPGSSIQVAVRTRPLTARERALASMPNSRYKGKNVSVVRCQDNMVILLDPDSAADSQERGRRERAYTFDYAFDETATNEMVYDKTARLLLDGVLEGYNACAFCYGMTGAGKTHTMMGSMADGSLDIAAVNAGTPLPSPRVKGIYTLTIEDIFQRIRKRSADKEYRVRVSFLEIYNEKIKDLLAPTEEQRKAALELQEDPVRGMVVQDLTEFEVSSLSEVQQIIMRGNARRTMAATGANIVSSRSHAIFQMSLEQRNRTRDIVEEVRVAKLSLIDLAGSERAAASDNRGLRMVEGANINRSLLALGNCINILGDRSKRGAFVPYRDSKLTRLLKDSLGGNTRTVMIANVSPSCLCYEETQNTLKYASRAKNITRKITRNVATVEAHISNYKQIIASLNSEITELKSKLRTQSSGSGGPSHGLSSSNGNDLDVVDLDDDMLDDDEDAPQNLVLQRVSTKDLPEDISMLLTPIDLEITRTKEEREAVQAELQMEKERSFALSSSFNGGRQSSGGDIADDAEFERVTNDLLGNLQERAELKQSLMDVDEQQRHTGVTSERLRRDIRSLQAAMPNARSQDELQAMNDQLHMAFHELENVDLGARENERTRRRLHQRLEENENEQRAIQTTFQRWRGSGKGVADLQVRVRQLRIEKLDEHARLLSMQKKVIVSEKELQAREKRIADLERQMDRLQGELREKEKMVQVLTSPQPASSNRSPAHNPSSSSDNIRNSSNNNAPIVASSAGASNVSGLARQLLRDMNGIFDSPNAAQPLFSRGFLESVPSPIPVESSSQTPELVIRSSPSQQSNTRPQPQSDYMYNMNAPSSSAPPPSSTYSIASAPASLDESDESSSLAAARKRLQDRVAEFAAKTKGLSTSPLLKSAPPPALPSSAPQGPHRPATADGQLLSSASVPHSRVSLNSITARPSSSGGPAPQPSYVQPQPSRPVPSWQDQQSQQPQFSSSRPPALPVSPPSASSTPSSLASSASLPYQSSSSNAYSDDFLSRYSALNRRDAPPPPPLSATPSQQSSNVSSPSQIQPQGAIVSASGSTFSPELEQRYLKLRLERQQQQQQSSGATLSPRGFSQQEPQPTPLQQHVESQRQKLASLHDNFLRSQPQQQPQQPQPQQAPNPYSSLASRTPPPSSAAPPPPSQQQQQQQQQYDSASVSQLLQRADALIGATSSASLQLQQNAQSQPSQSSLSSSSSQLHSRMSDMLASSSSFSNRPTMPSSSSSSSSSYPSSSSSSSSNPIPSLLRSAPPPPIPSSSSKPSSSSASSTYSSIFANQQQYGSSSLGASSSSFTPSLLSSSNSFGGGSSNNAVFGSGSSYSRIGAPPPPATPSANIPSLFSSSSSSSNSSSRPGLPGSSSSISRQPISSLSMVFPPPPPPSSSASSQPAGTFGMGGYTPSVTVDLSRRTSSAPQVVAQHRFR